MNNESEKSFPLGLKIAAGYLVIGGIAGLIWPLLGLGPNHPEFEVLSSAAKAGKYFRETLINSGMLVCGTALLYRKAWARRGALIVLAVAAFYGGSAFAWGYARGAPNAEALVIGYGAMVLWNSIWFFLIYRKSSAEALH